MQTIENYNPLEFQMVSIKNLIEIIDINNGGCIFDETGLGKTITSLTTAINISDKILVISTKSNLKLWEKVSKNIRNKEIKITTVQSIHKINGFVPEFVIVDEAHNFRNNKNKSYIDLFEIIFNSNSKVLLLTATPFNNNYYELKAMFSLILYNYNTYPFFYLGKLFDDIYEIEKKIKNLEIYGNYSYKNISTEVKLKFDLYLDKVNKLKKVVSSFSIRNTRNDILINFPNDVKKIGSFPVINYSDSIDVSKNNEFYKIIGETLKIIDKMPLARQNMIFYLDKFKTNDNSDFSSLYKCLLLKRLDSSIYSFKKTLENSLNELIKLKNNNISNINSLNIIVNNNKLKLNDTKFWNKIDIDIIFFEKLLKLWSNQNDNDKINKLKEIINLNKTQKFVVFTEYNDTLELIKNSLNNKGVIFYTSKTNMNELDKIQYEFDANIDISEQTNKYNVIVCSDVLSEGVSLHRASNVIHFDSKWNPAKHTQRNGRVNRITINSNTPKQVNVVRFGTDYIIENIIKLENKINKKSLDSERFLDFTYNPNPFNQSRFKYSEYNNVLSFKTSDLGISKIRHVIKSKNYDIILKKDVFLEYYDISVDVENLNNLQLSGYVEVTDNNKSYYKNLSRTFKRNHMIDYLYNINQKFNNQFSKKIRLIIFNPLYLDFFISKVKNVLLTKADKNIEFNEIIKNVLGLTNIINDIEYTTLFISNNGRLLENDKFFKI